MSLNFWIIFSLLVFGIYNWCYLAYFE